MVRQPAIEYIDKYYEMDPSTEDLVFDGKYLQDGMVVLVGDQRFRGDTQAEMTPDRAEEIKTFNRWCSISHVTHTPSGPGAMTFFLAIYGDGTKRKVGVPTVWPWLVKLDSLPMPPALPEVDYVDGPQHAALPPADRFEYGELRGHPSRDNEVAMRTYDLNDQGTPRHLEERGDHTTVFRFPLPTE